MLVEESVRNWDEFELEVVRDKRDNVVVVCSIENLDPMGVHTGDSVTVAPQMTLSDEAYQELRDASAAVIRAVGVETGGSNIQFARERETGELRVIEMNPRVSRSSALASKATGYPIAKVAAKLAVGYTLDEIPNDLTKTTPASFEPTLDYVVVKFPRFAFEKFPGADRTLGTQMKSVGEAMGIGRTFREAFWKAMRSRELDAGAVTPWSDLDDLPEAIHPWFRRELERLRDEGPPSGKRVYRRVDSCAGEVAAESNYYYSTFGEADEAPPCIGQAAGRDHRLRSEPDRPGDRVRLLLRARRAELPCAGLRGSDGQLQPGDGLDRLRHLRPALLRAARRGGGAGDLRARAAGGRRDPVRRPDAAEARARDRGRRVPDPRDALRRDRPRRGPGALRELLSQLGIRCPDWGIAESGREAAELAHRIGYPVLVRPSYVLGGRAMRVCYRGAEVVEAFRADFRGKVLVDRFVENAIEIDVDALCDGEETYIAAVMQHVEEAGVHSGDSACVLPAPSLTSAAAREVEDTVRRLAPALGTVGLINVQLAVAEDAVYVLEANPRASRTVPFASKATGLNLVEAACRLAAGAKLRDLALPPERPPTQVSVKAAVLPFARFPGSDPVLGPEMRATGEVMASASDLPTAFAKAERAAGRPLPTSGTAFLSVRDADKPALRPVAAALAGLGFRLVATEGTARELEAAGLEVERVAKVAEGGDATVVDLVRRGKCDLVINTPFGGSLQRTDGYRIREAALIARIPCITTISGAAAAVHAIANARTELALSLQERIDVETRTANGS